MDDFRLYINPQPKKGRFSAAWQRELMPAGDEYVEDKHGEQIELLIRSVRPGAPATDETAEVPASVVVVRKLWCLAPWAGSPTIRKRELARRIDRIKAAGGCVMEAEGGRRTDRDGCAEMIADALIDMQNSGRRPKKLTPGRPRKQRSEAEIATMKAEYFSRMNPNVPAVIAALEASGVKTVTQGELYRLFGPRNPQT